MENEPLTRSATVRFADTVRQIEESLQELNNVEKSDEETHDKPGVDNSDDGWDTDLETPSKETRKPRRSADITGKSCYLRTCRTLGVPPVSAVLDAIRTSEITLAHHGIGPQGGRALAKALAKSTMVEKLDLQENSLGEEGVACIGKMLLENCYIKYVSLAGNIMGSNGARTMGNVIAENRYLQWLDLSFNNFVDKDAKPLSDGLQSTTTLKYFNLSQNSFCEAGGEFIGPALAENNTITELNLSWNHLRLKGAIAICKGMSDNSSIEILDLAWNGFADEGAEAMGEALKKNDTFLELDLSHNRITEKGAQGLARGLQVNQTLRVLKIGSNPLGNSGCYALMKAIKANANSALEELHLDNITVKKNSIGRAFQVIIIILYRVLNNSDAEHWFTASDVLSESRRLEIGIYHGTGVTWVSAVPRFPYPLFPDIAFPSRTRRYIIKITDAKPCMIFTRSYSNKVGMLFIANHTWRSVSRAFLDVSIRLGRLCPEW